VTAFDFGKAVGVMFTTPDGKGFAWRLLFWTTAAMSIVMLISLPFILPHYLPLLEYNAQNMQAILSGQNPPAPDPDIILNAFGKILIPAIIMTMFFWAALAAGEAALHRKVLLGKEYPKRPIRFGKDELRVMLAQLGVWGLFFLVYFGFVLVMMVGAVIPVLGVILIIIAILAVFPLMIYVPVKFAPAAALSIFKDRPHLLAARHVTKHRFWALFGAYCVVFIGGYFLIYAVMLAVLILVTGDPDFMFSIYGMGDSSPSDVFAAAGERLKNPLFMLVAILGVIAYSLAYTFWFLSIAGIGSYAVKWWHDDNPGPQFE